MKIITYNIHQGRDRAGRSNLARVADELVARGPDVIALQEVLGVATHDHGDQAAWLASRLGMHVRFVANAETRHGPLGNATLARRPITASDNLDLSVPGFEPRGVLRIELDGGVGVWNIHLGLTRRQRREQWRRIAAALASSAGETVVCGDFNDWGGWLHRSAEQAGLRSALWGSPRSRRATFPAHRPWLGLDRLYYRGFRLVDSEVLRGAPWRQLSDHLPVEVTFARPSAADERGSHDAWDS